MNLTMRAVKEVLNAQNSSPEYALLFSIYNVYSCPSTILRVATKSHMKTSLFYAKVTNKSTVSKSGMRAVIPSKEYGSSMRFKHFCTKKKFVSPSMY